MSQMGLGRVKTALAMSPLAIEIKPAFVDLAIRRWQAFTGEKAIRESDGVHFDTLLPSADLQKVDPFSSLDQTF